MSAGKHGRQHSTRRTPHICTSLVWLGFRCTPGTQKRFLAGIDRHALSLLALCPAKVGPGGPACMAWMGGVASLAALHSCIRAPPQRNLVTLQRHPSLCCCCSPVPGRAWMRVERDRGARTSRPVLHARASCVSWVHHPPPHAPLNSTAFPPTFWPGETPLPTYSCGGAACVCACSARPILDNTTPALFLLLSLLLLLLLPLAFLHPRPSAALATCLPACLPACLLLLGRVNCCSPDRKSSRTSHRTHPHTCRRI